MGNRFGPLRLPFLILTPACCALGYAMAVLDGVRPQLFDVALVLIGALSAHISVNALNEYEDFQSGLDFRTEPTPFSGGSGTLPMHPELSGYTFIVGIAALVITLLVGSYFLWQRGVVILPFGFLGVVIIATYTRYLTRRPWLCLIAAGLAFGPLMVGGTYVALTGQLTAQVMLISLIPFFLVNNLLLLNQYPDLVADASIGRRNLPIVYGLHRANLVYLVSAVATLVVLYIISRSISFTLLGYLGMALLLPLLPKLFRHERDPRGLVPFLGLNVAVSILTPVLISLGILIQAG